MEDCIKKLTKDLKEVEDVVMAIGDEENNNDEKTNPAKKKLEVKKELGRKTRELKITKEELDATIKTKNKLMDEQVSSQNAIRHLTEYLDMVKKINRDLEITLAKNGMSALVDHQDNPNPNQAIHTQLVYDADDEEGYKEEENETDTEETDLELEHG